MGIFSARSRALRAHCQGILTERLLAAIAAGEAELLASVSRLDGVVEAPKPGQRK